MRPRQKQLVVPVAVIGVVCLTLLFTHRANYTGPLSSQGFKPEGTPEGTPEESVEEIASNLTSAAGPVESAKPIPGYIPPDSYWTDEEAASLPPWENQYYRPWELSEPEPPIPDPGYHAQDRENRLRYENSDIWRTEDTLLDQNTGIEGLVRYKSPPRSHYKSDGAYLRHPIAGNYKYGADKLFLMFKTGTDTQWKRMPHHFLSDLTHAHHFALYSDAPGSLFGHEIIDIMATIPQEIIDDRWELQRYKAQLQSHDERWNWAPEELKGSGGWEADRYKNIPMLLDAYTKNPNCDWYLWVDDDSFMFYDSLVRWLDTMDPNEMIHIGKPSGISFGGHSLYFAHGGSVVVASRAVVEALFGPPEKRKHSMTDQELITKWAHEAVDVCCGDVLFTWMLIRELEMEMYTHPMWGEYLFAGGPHQGEGLSGVRIPDGCFCNPLVTWHHLTPHEMEVLYTYDRLWDKDRWITYHDIYRDFFLPYITDERPNWRIPDLDGAWIYPSEEWPLDKPVKYNDNYYTPAHSKEECKRLCEDTKECAAWTWKAEYCLNQHGFVFGAASNRWNEKEGYVSGWMIDRIRQWRADSPCDPLTYENGEYNDDPSTSEGWMLRKLDKERPEGASESDSTIPIHWAEQS